MLLFELTNKYPLIELLLDPQLVKVSEKSTEFTSRSSINIDVTILTEAELYLNNPVPGSPVNVLVEKLYLSPAPSP